MKIHKFGLASMAILLAFSLVLRGDDVDPDDVKTQLKYAYEKVSEASEADGDPIEFVDEEIRILTERKQKKSLPLRVRQAASEALDVLKRQRKSLEKLEADREKRAQLREDSFAELRKIVDDGGECTLTVRPYDEEVKVATLEVTAEATRFVEIRSGEFKVQMKEPKEVPKKTVVEVLLLKNKAGKAVLHVEGIEVIPPKVKTDPNGRELDDLLIPFKTQAVLPTFASGAVHVFGAMGRYTLECR